jgi:hypothetical protein
MAGHDTLGAAMNRRPKLTIVAPDASPEEAAAVVAALERFMRDTAPAPAPPAPSRSPWLEAALHEGVSRQPALPSPWD